MDPSFLNEGGVVIKHGARLLPDARDIRGISGLYDRLDSGAILHAGKTDDLFQAKMRS
jgi:hypothetical protein